MCIVKCWVKAVVFLLSVAAIQGSAQSAPESQSRAKEAQARGYWTDPSTGLVWAGKDNGKDVNWKNAVKYCRDLRLAGYSNWSLRRSESWRRSTTRTQMLPGVLARATADPSHGT